MRPRATLSSASLSTSEADGASPWIRTSSPNGHPPAQSLVTSIGIIAGGVWVLFTFWNLRLMHRCRAELAEIEQRAVEQPVLSLAIHSDTTEAVSGEKRFISVCALLRNDGRRAAEFWAAVLSVFSV